jgi:alpha-glucosidase (family GH31 glycosyl hydrolase)
MRVENVPLDRLPVYARAGHILALGRDVAHTGEIDRRNPIAEIVAFGMPRTAPVIGDGLLSLEADGTGMVLAGTPDARVRTHDCTATRAGGRIVFAR